MPLMDDVKQRLSIVDVVSEYVPLNKLHSRTPEANCPFHEESTPSFKLSTERDTWRCYGACQTGGDIFEFVKKIERIEFGEALDKLCDMAGIERRRDDEPAERSRKPSKSETDAIHEINELAADYWHKQLGTPVGAEAREYLEGRGIDLEKARRWKIGFAPAGPDSLMHYLKSMRKPARDAARAGVVVKPADGAWRDMFQNRITFAIFDRNSNIVGFAGRAMEDGQPKYMNTRETESFRKSQLLYGLHVASDAIRETGRAVIVEGYLDVITAHTHGFRNVVASMGTAVTPQQLRAATAALPYDGRRELVFALDADAAGQQAAMDSLRIALESLRTRRNQDNPFEIKVATASAAGGDASDAEAPKDPDEAIRQDAAGWAQSIESAFEAYQFIVEAQLRNGGDALSAVEPFLENPASDTARIRWLSERTGIEYSVLVETLNQIRVRRTQSEQSRRGNRGKARNVNGASGNGSRPATGNFGNAIARDLNGTATPSSEFRPVEYELAACLMQNASALDYAEGLEPLHFGSPRLRKLYELRLQCDSPDDLEALIDDDESLLSLFQELRAHEVEMSGFADADDESRLMKAVNACTARAKELSTRSRIRGFGNEMLECADDPERVGELVGESTRASRELSTLLANPTT